MPLVDLGPYAIDETVTALNMRINHIETGTTFYNALDAQSFNRTLNSRNPTDQKRMIKINPLSPEQRKLLALLEETRDTLLKARPKELKLNYSS